MSLYLVFIITLIVSSVSSIQQSWLNPQSPDQAFDSPIYWYISGKPGLFLTYLQCYRRKSQIRPVTLSAVCTGPIVYLSPPPPRQQLRSRKRKTRVLALILPSRCFRMDNQLLPHLTPSTCSQSAPDRQIQTETCVHW